MRTLGEYLVYKIPSIEGIDFFSDVRDHHDRLHVIHLHFLMEPAHGQLEQ